MREPAPAEDVHLRRLDGDEASVDEALVAARPGPALGRRLLPIDAVGLGRAALGRGEGDRPVRPHVDVGYALLHRRAEGAGGGFEEPVAEDKRLLLDREDAALDVIDVAAPQLVEITDVAVRGEAVPAFTPPIGRPEAERLQSREAGILDALMVVRDREVTDVVDLPRGHAAPTGIDPRVRHGRRLASGLRLRPADR